MHSGHKGAQGQSKGVRELLARPRNQLFSLYTLIVLLKSQGVELSKLERELEQEQEQEKQNVEGAEEVAKKWKTTYKIRTLANLSMN